MKILYDRSSITDPSTQRLTWFKSPLSVLVIKKIYDASVIEPFKELVKWLVKEKNMVVLIEQKVLDEPLLKSDSEFEQIKRNLCSFREGVDDLADRVDFIVCLGGDGTLLYASSLFQQSVPPVVAFHLGSLGFLSPVMFEDYKETLTKVINGNAGLTLRIRLKCVMEEKDALNQQMDKHDPFMVLNDVVIDRGPSPYLTNLDLYIEDRLVTSVQGDGLIISTPTGSTAYAAAAGASMIHPTVPAILITPICPHSLSFRPIIVPAGVELKIKISPDARSTAWVACDGRNREELKHGNCLRIVTSMYPLPSVCGEDHISDWFNSLASCLHWNVRKTQRHFSNADNNGEQSNGTLSRSSSKSSTSGDF